MHVCIFTHLAHCVFAKLFLQIALDLILDLSHNLLETIGDSQLLKFPNLQLLNLAHNELSTIPYSLSMIECFCSAFCGVCVSGEILKHFLFYIEYLTSLEVLNLTDNSLKKVPGAIGFMMSLKTLLLSNNKFYVSYVLLKKMCARAN